VAICRKGENIATANLMVEDKHHFPLYTNCLYCVRRLYEECLACNYVASLRGALGEDSELAATPQEEDRARWRCPDGACS
jgi:hypothetical protein